MEWYCIHTRPLQESRVAAHLDESLGVETYLPRLKQFKTIRRVRRSIIGPLFPGYLFGRFDLSYLLRAVKYSPGVIDVVTFGQRPAPLDEGLIEGLKSWAGEAVDIISLQSDLRVGDRVEINDGPMRGLQAVIFQARNDRERVAVMLSILEGGAQKMFIDRSQLTCIK